MREKRICFLWSKMVMLFVVLAFSALIVPGAEKCSAAVYGKSFEQKKAVELYEQGKFTVSRNSITLKKDESANGIMISGNADDFAKAVFSYGGTFDFALEKVDYFVVDALAERKKNMEIAFYLDDDTKPFTTVKLAKQKKKEIWSTVKNRCSNISKKRVTGIHKLRFKVITQETGKLQLAFRAVTFMKSDIPTVEFNLDESQGSIAEMNGDSSHNTECYGNVTLNIPNDYQSEYSQRTFETETYELDYIRGRGNSTWMTEKRPYKFKLEKKQDLLGMGKNKHWVLLANYYDITMLRNKLTYWLGKELGMEFTPKCEFVNVVMNGEYLGSYYLCEQVRVGENRVDIDDLEKDDATKAATDEKTISGGYLLSMCPYGDELNEGFTTNRSNSFLIESPSFEDYKNEAQKNYIIDYIQKTEDAIYGENFKDETGKSYQEYMDIDSAVDYYWIQEFSMNGDAFMSTSTYLYKKRNGKLYWGPLWDFDFVAWGATEYNENNCSGFSQNGNMWFRRLFDDPEFYQKVVKRWPVIKKKLLEACKPNGQIDKYSEKQYESQKHNYEIWQKYCDSFGGWDWNFGDGEEKKEITYDSEVSRLKDWIQERVNWIDDNLEKLKKEYYTVKFMVDEVEYDTVHIEKGNYVGEFPIPPEKEGYAFKGWYVENSDGEEYELTTDIEILEDITVKAKWVELGELIPVEKIGLLKSEYFMYSYDSIYLKYCVLPFDADNSGIVWESSDESIVTVMDGCVSAQGAVGDVVITATASNGVSASCVVHVKKYDEFRELKAIELDKEEIKIKVGEYDQIQVQYSPEDGYCYQGIKFQSSDESVVKVNDCGYLCGLKEGTAVVVCYTYDLKAKFCKVTVTK